MKPENSIEEHFRSEFSDWNPTVPASVKSKVDEKIAATPKKKAFWLWFFLPFSALLLMTTIFISIFSKDELNDDESVSESSKIQNVVDSNASQNSHISTSEIVDSTSSQSVSITNASSNNTHLDAPVSNASSALNQSKARGANGSSSVNRDLNSSPKKPSQTGYVNNNAIASSNGNINPATSQQFASDENRESTNNSQVSSNTSNNATGSLANSSNHNPEESSLNPNSSSPNIQTESNENSIIAEEKDENVTRNQYADDENNKSEGKFFIGATVGIMQGINTWSNSNNQLTENLSFSPSFEMAYKFRNRFALVSGFNYQNRKEMFQAENTQIDSLFSGIEIQYIYEPGTNIIIDSITVITYNYDTTFSSTQNRGIYNQLTLPLFLDWTMLNHQKFVVGIQFGPLIGFTSFKRFDEQNILLDGFTRLSTQLMLKPYFYYNIGPWSFGVYLSTQYDLVLPQSWDIQNRKRYAFGLGFGIRYHLPTK